MTPEVAMAPVVTAAAPSRHRAMTASLLACVGLMLLPALWNGFPLVFSDTGIYLEAAINHHAPIDRPLFYSLFALALHWKTSLWPVVAAQALLTFYLVRLFFKTYARRFAEWQVALAIALLTMLSSLPWFVGQLMPDLFAGLLILALAIGVLNQDRLARADRWALALLATFFMSTHLSYLPVAALVIGCAALLRAGEGQRRGERLRALPSRFNLALVGALALAVALIVSVNVAAKKGATLAYVGNVMMLAKLIDQGIAVDYLDDSCGARPLPICAALPELKAMRADARLRHLPIGSVSDAFLWGPEMKKLGDFGAVRVYASEINRGALRRYPLEFIRQSLAGFAAQSVQFQLGDDLKRYGDDTLLYHVIEDSFGSRVFARYQAARQYAGALDLDALRTVSNAVAVLSLLALLAFLLARGSQSPALARVIVVILFGIVVNMAVTGALSAVHDRYGSRVIWLLPMLALFIGIDFFKPRRARGAPAASV